MITDEDYKNISDRVYDVDSGKVANPVKTGDAVAAGQFQVLRAEDNTDNGMQAMSVAPVDNNGNVDYSEVVIAYAGTNQNDFKNFETDLQSIGLGSDKLSYVKTIESDISGQWIANENPINSKIKVNVFCILSLCYTISTLIL
ncbi:hypothetical protein [Streptococcus loxodontisalivarius]|uniref:Uncharacterized protein n=1 Tax=Streptococcus loxodontisalivarius TaxID=1349415 RepID=A0ABS2PS40_9STRE|nr:hypothetical protein [Streptococcus loxodontisalivarius]MBM7642743.1 hypothetical protein [Streptococcus loxodontisalivarius]